MLSCTSYKIRSSKFRQDALDGGLAPLVFACRCRDTFVGQRLGDAVWRHALEEHAVDAFDHFGLLPVDHQIPILASVVAEEPFEWDRDLAVCKTLSLAPCAVLGNGPAFFLRKARHDGQQDFSLAVKGPDVFLLEIDLDAVFLQLPDGGQGVNRVPRKTADGLGDDSSSSIGKPALMRRSILT